MATRGHMFRLFVVGAAGLVFSGGHSFVIRATKLPSGRHHGPVRVHRVRDQSSQETYNWSGYAVTGQNGSVTDVKASWVVPSVSCAAAPQGYSAFWTGIDGWTSNSVEQIGTDSDCDSLTNQADTPTYYAWFEFYPQAGYLIGNYTNAGVCKSGCVYPGDTISAEVSYSGTGSGPRGGPRFTVTIIDVTRGWEFTTSSAVNGAKQSSAEWIAEAPSGCNTAGSICTLPDFGIVNFGASATGLTTTSYATVSGVTKALGSFSTVQEATMVSYPSGSAIMAQPSAPLDNGTSFSVAWANPGP